MKTLQSLKIIHSKDDLEDTPKIQQMLQTLSPKVFTLPNNKNIDNKAITIGVCGGPSAGKLLFSEMLRRQLSKKGINTNVVKQEKFLIKSTNEDMYKNHDWQRFVTEVNKELDNPDSVLIVEGTLILHNEDIRNKLTIKVYLDTDEDIRLSRKVFKDVCIKKRDVGDVIEKYLSILKPLYQKFVLPSKRYAEIVIPNYGGGFSTIYKEGQAAGFDCIEHPVIKLVVDNVGQAILLKQNQQKMDVLTLDLEENQILQ